MGDSVIDSAMIDSKIFINEGWYWPKYDKRPDKCLRKVTAFLNDISHAIELSNQKKCCIQAGGHAGIWPIELAKHYKNVFTFEPEKILFECMFNNALKENASNIFMSPQALGPECKDAKFKSHSSAGSWRIADDGDYDVHMVTIDSLNLKYCDAIFLDVEQYEIPVLQGALQTIKEFSPILHVEILAGEKDKMDDFMRSINYKHVIQTNSDHIYVPLQS